MGRQLRLSQVDDAQLREALLQLTTGGNVSALVSTGLDYQAVQNYLKYVVYKSDATILSVFIICILIGCLGNCYLLFLFGDPRSRVYRSRDGLYFRRLALIDLLVCACVLPYCACYEYGIIRNSYLCKTLEPLRHTLTYTSHLSLALYARELAHRRGYEKTCLYLRRASVVVVCVSVLASVPTVLVFESGDRGRVLKYMEAFYGDILVDIPELFSRVLYQEGRSQPLEVQPLEILFSPDYCHLSFNVLSSRPGWRVQREATMAYYSLTAALYLACLAVCFTQLLRYLDSHTTGDPGSLSVLVSGETSVSRNRTGGETEQHVHHTSCVHVAGEISPENLVSPGLQDIREVGTCVDTMAGSVTSLHALSGELRAPGPALQELLVRLSREVEERDARAKIDGEEEEEGDVRAQEGGEEEDGEEEEEWENKADQDRADTGWMGCGHLGHALTTPRSGVSGQRPVLKTSGETTLGLSCYTDQFVAFLLLDMAVVSCCCLVYLVVTETSLVLNLVHLKSVFSFYFFSAFNKQLRRRVYRRGGGRGWWCGNSRDEGDIRGSDHSGRHSVENSEGRNWRHTF